MKRPISDEGGKEGSYFKGGKNRRTGGKNFTHFLINWKKQVEESGEEHSKGGRRPSRCSSEAKQMRRGGDF